MPWEPGPTSWHLLWQKRQLEGGEGIFSAPPKPAWAQPLQILAVLPLLLFRKRRAAGLRDLRRRAVESGRHLGGLPSREGLFGSRVKA